MVFFFIVIVTSITWRTSTGKLTNETKVGHNIINVTTGLERSPAHK